MNAIVQSKYGPPSVLTLAEVDPPRMGATDVRVEVHGSVVTWGDRRLRTGDFPGITWLPGRLFVGLTGPRHRPGTMFAGRVVAVGADVRRFAVGDRVFGSSLEQGGAWSDELTIPAEGRLAAIPEGLGFVEAAALPYGAVTSLIYLRDLAAVQPGERVCIVGAAGGVGVLAVQIARHLGAEVTAVCAAADHALVRSHGAHHVVDRHTEDFREGTYDVVFDVAGASTFAACRRALSPQGRYLSLLVTVRLLVEAAFTRRARVGVALGDASHFEEIRRLVASGALRPVLDRTFPRAEIAAAHERLESGAPRGTVGIAIRTSPFGA